MTESGGVPSDSGKRGSFADSNAFFLKVGRETLDDTRVREVRSRLRETAFGDVEGLALAFFAGGIRVVRFDDVEELMNETLDGLWLSATLESELMTRTRDGTAYHMFQRGSPEFLSSLLDTSSDLAARLRTCAFYWNWADAHPSLA